MENKNLVMEFLQNYGRVFRCKRLTELKSVKACPLLSVFFSISVIVFIIQWEKTVWDGAFLS